jgi:16S rRNA G527 N7-methylase RsmG
MLEERGIGSIPEEKRRLLFSFAGRVLSENRKYNLTGHSILEDVLENLVIDSIAPLAGLKVPRGTFFADLGTGGGFRESRCPSGWMRPGGGFSIPT